MKKVYTVALGATTAIVAVTAVAVWMNYDRLIVFPKKRALVTQHFKDPDSAQFRNEKYDGLHLCGEVNAKNSHGAYVGFERYIAASENAVYLESEGNIVGESKRDSHEKFEEDMKATDLQIQRVRLQNQLLDEGKKQSELPPRLSNEEALAMVRAEDFERKWKLLCS